MNCHLIWDHIAEHEDHEKFGHSEGFLNIQQPKLIQSQTRNEFNVFLATLARVPFLEQKKRS